MRIRRKIRHLKLYFRKFRQLRKTGRSKLNYSLTASLVRSLSNSELIEKFSVLLLPSLIFLYQLQTGVNFPGSNESFSDIILSVLQILAIVGGLLLTFAIFFNQFIYSENQNTLLNYNEEIEKLTGFAESLPKNSKSRKMIWDFLQKLHFRKPANLRRDEKFWEKNVSPIIFQFKKERIEVKTKGIFLFERIESSINRSGIILVMVLYYVDRIHRDLFRIIGTIILCSIILMAPFFVSSWKLQELLPVIAIALVFRCGFLILSIMFLFLDFLKDIEATEIDAGA